MMYRFSLSLAVLMSCWSLEAGSAEQVRRDLTPEEKENIARGVSFMTGNPKIGIAWMPLIVNDNDVKETIYCVSTSQRNIFSANVKLISGKIVGFESIELATSDNDVVGRCERAGYGRFFGSGK